MVRGGKVELLEGEWQPSRLVVLELGSAKWAREWWLSQRYSGPKSIRQRTATSKLILVEGE
jgi:uncharacterized protein (DUF1330 family)